MKKENPKIKFLLIIFALAILLTIIGKIAAYIFLDTRSFQNEALEVSFNYPPSWEKHQKDDYVTLVKDPLGDLPRQGDCPGYSFYVSKPKRADDYSFFLPVKKSQLDGQTVEVSDEKYWGNNCYKTAIFVNTVKNPRLVIQMLRRGTNSRHPLDQILSTLKLIN